MVWDIIIFFPGPSEATEYVKGPCKPSAISMQTSNSTRIINMVTTSLPTNYLCCAFLCLLMVNFKKSSLIFPCFPWLDPSFEDLMFFLKTFFQVFLPWSLSPRAVWRPLHSYYSFYFSQPWGSAKHEADSLWRQDKSILGCAESFEKVGEKGNNSTIIS